MNSKKRNQLKRERREMHDRNVEITALSGRELTPELIDFVFDFYLSTVEKFAWGRQYLKRELFEEIAKTMPDELHVVAARQSGRLVGGAFNFWGKTRSTVATGAPRTRCRSCTSTSASTSESKSAFGAG